MRDNAIVNEIILREMSIKVHTWKNCVNNYTDLKFKICGCKVIFSELFTPGKLNKFKIFLQTNGLFPYIGELIEIYSTKSADRKIELLRIRSIAREPREIYVQKNRTMIELYKIFDDYKLCCV
jgi:hypothetical protein